MNKGLGKPELRSVMATAILTSAEFNYLKKHPEEVNSYSDDIKKEFQSLLLWQKRSDAAKRAAITRRRNQRKKYYE